MEKRTDEMVKLLIVKHLPEQLTDSDVQDLLASFGAEDVKTFGSSGPLKYCAIAQFSSEDCAWKALQVLHQAKVLGRRLSVEFAKKCHYDLEEERSKKKQSDVVSESTVDNSDIIESKNIGILSTKWNIPYFINPKLKYSYPPPTPQIINNISSAMIAVPRFYTQVLHLMNKMNLPPPFAGIHPAPPLVEPVRNWPVVGKGSEEQEEDEIETVEMEEVSTEESELESDTEDKMKPVVVKPVKRLKLGKKRKKPAIKSLLHPGVPPVKKPSVLNLKPEEVFEQPDVTIAKKIDVKIIPAVSASEATDNQIFELPAAPREESVKEGGFGKLEPVAKPVEDEEESEEEDEETDETHEFISRRRLEKGCLSSSEMKSMSVFRNYNPGEASTRLYIKNLAKQTTDKDLRYIFGRYVDWKDETQKQMFDIRLMKEGRMKGQAFVTLGSENSAKYAVKETNSYVLHGKAIVVQFARSAKSKS